MRKRKENVYKQASSEANINRTYFAPRKPLAPILRGSINTSDKRDPQQSQRVRFTSDKSSPTTTSKHLKHVYVGRPLKYTVSTPRKSFKIPTSHSFVGKRLCKKQKSTLFKSPSDPNSPLAIINAITSPSCNQPSQSVNSTQERIPDDLLVQDGIPSALTSVIAISSGDMLWIKLLTAALNVLLAALWAICFLILFDCNLPGDRNCTLPFQPWSI